MKIRDLPDEICRKIYSYILDLTVLNKLRIRYTENEYPDFSYRYDDRIVLYNGHYHFIEKHFYFPSIVSCYWFDSGMQEIEDFDDLDSIYN